MRCSASMTYADGSTQQCAAERAIKGGGTCCYYHEKVLAGLCSPVEYGDDAITESYDKVVSVKSGDRIRRFA